MEVCTALHSFPRFYWCLFHSASSSHDDLLFFSIILTGFHALMQLSELVWPDKKNLQDYCKVSMWNTIEVLPEGYSFFLPGHKADRFFEGNHIIVPRNAAADVPYPPFLWYLTSCDCLFPLHPELWLWQDSSIPTCGWFICRLCQHFPSDVSGHSMHTGGATVLTKAGIPPHIIQAIGWWASDAFQIYIHHHPMLLTALVYCCAPLSTWLYFGSSYHTSLPSFSFLFFSPLSFLGLPNPMATYFPTIMSGFNPVPSGFNSIYFSSHFSL